MSKSLHAVLSRRERQIMEIVYRKGSATATEVLAEMSDPPSYSAVRTLLRILEEKGYLRHEQQEGEGPLHRGTAAASTPASRQRPTMLISAANTAASSG